MTRIEYAVRSAQGGKAIIEPVDDEVLARQKVTELLACGIEARPVTRVVTEWDVDETALAGVHRDAARETVLNIAQLFWEEEIDEVEALAQLRPFAPDMSDHDRAERLGELVSELEHQEDVDERRTAKVQPGPEQDWRDLEADAERRVHDAADELIAGTPSFDVLMQVTAASAVAPLDQAGAGATR